MGKPSLVGYIPLNYIMCFLNIPTPGKIYLGILYKRYNWEFVHLLRLSITAVLFILIEKLEKKTTLLVPKKEIFHKVA